MIYKWLLAAFGVTFALGSNAALSQEDGQAQGKLASVAGKCHAAADYVNELNKKSPGIIQFRPKTGKGAWWCAVTDREGTLLAIRSSDTNEDGCDKTEFKSDAARLSELIAIAKAWTTSFSNSEAPVDSKTVGLASRIDDTAFFGGSFGTATGTNVGPAPLWGVWATNLLRHDEERASGYRCGKRHFGVVPFAGGQPVYDCNSGKLLGGAGASGDSVDSDDLVTKRAITSAGFCITPPKVKK
jgi:hypothetical protein